MARLTYITGPVRSGKSRRAVELARSWGDDVVFVATYRQMGGDTEMDDRVSRHRRERPAWRTLENVADVASALEAMDPAPGGVLMDCLTLWLADRMDQGDEAILAEWDALLEAIKEAPWPAVIVGNEIGWAPVPMDPGLRRFRDLAGWLAQRTAAASDEAWLMVSGCRVPLK